VGEADAKGRSTGDEPVKSEKPESRLRKWAKRVGLVGIAFFAVKGLVWLVVAAAVAWGARK
jgi:hypothetical protein